jgi:hypothetical protein
MSDTADNPMKSALLRSCRHLLAPVVRMLLRGGVTWAEFADMGKEVYVDMARRDYGLQGRPTNSARVAMLTGLSRREVGRVKDILEGEAPREPAPLDRLSQVLTGWHRDPEFLASGGEPLDLEADGEKNSLAALLRRYAGDMPHGAVVKELESLGLVARHNGRFRVTARSYVRSAGDPDRIRQAGIALHDHAETIAHNVNADRADAARFERMATSAALPAQHVSAFNDFVAERGQALLEEIDDWLDLRSRKDVEVSDGAAIDTLRCGIGVYLIQNEAKGVDRD